MCIVRIWIVLLSLVSVHATVWAETPNWNQWRGPERDGHLTGQNLPNKLDKTLSLLWERPHAASYSGPIVCGNLVITTHSKDGREAMIAHDRQTGDIAWLSDWEGSMTVPFFAAANGSWFKSTPACDGQNVVVMGMQDVMVCVDVKTGDRQWMIDFPKTLGHAPPTFGSVCSPLIDGDFVYVQTGGATVKVKIDDGTVVWQTLNQNAGMMSGGAFSSPVIATLDGTKQLVVQTRTELCGVDLETGSVWWRQPIEAFRGMNILTPTIIGDAIFTAAHSGRSERFDITNHEGGWSVTRRWSQKVQGYMSSPVVVGSSIFLHAKNQRVICLDAQTGDIRWTSRPQGKYWSMITDGQRILALDSDGQLLLVAADPQSFRVIDQQKVADNSWAHLAVDRGQLFVRDLNSLKAYRFD